MAFKYTHRQGQYLGFIHYYMLLHRVAPTESEIANFLRAFPPSVHQVLKTMENNGLIERIPRQARSIRILIPVEELPGLDGTPPSTSPAATYPNIAAWLDRGGMIEMGWEPHTGTFARALDEGGSGWQGGDPDVPLNENLRALDRGVGEWMRELGI